jgi:glycosyltransferase involved in cell wall biosynthesis
MKSMKIVVISAVAQSLVNFRGPLLATLVSERHEVVACAPGQDILTRSIEDVIARLNELGVTYRAIDLDRTGLTPVKDLRALLSLSKLLKEMRPDIVLSYNHKPIIYGSLAARLAGVPRRFSIITGLGFVFGEDTLKRRMINTLVGRLYRLGLADSVAVFFQNPDDLAFFVRSKLVADPTQTVLINGSGVDLDHFSEVPPYTQRPAFLLVARLIREKGIIEYIDAARTLKRRYPQAAFRILGSFDDHPSCVKKSQIEAWQREGTIEYLGVVKDVRPSIACASVFVLPSYYGEGTPRSTLEAMAMGRPIITTNTPGCRETVVEEENGFLVPAKDVTALVEAMEKFILRPGLLAPMGKQSRRIATEKYDVQKVNTIIMKTMRVYGNKANANLS